MYKRVGIDPTKTRPSSEALLRRVRKGDPLPRINSMVDVCNWCSLEFQLPYGLYDAAQIEGDVELRLGSKASPIRASARTMCTSAGGSRWPTRGPFGNPTSDSARTMVTTATTRALLVVFAPRDLETKRLAGARRHLCSACRSSPAARSGASALVAPQPLPEAPGRQQFCKAGGVCHQEMCSKSLPRRATLATVLAISAFTAVSCVRAVPRLVTENPSAVDVAQLWQEPLISRRAIFFTALAARHSRPMRRRRSRSSARIAAGTARVRRARSRWQALERQARS